MKKTIIINQPFGAGDIIFCQSIANDFVNAGFNVIWPMKEVYVSLGKHFPNITVIDERLINVDLARREEFEANGARVIPLQYAANILKLQVNDCMKAKYKFLGKDWNDWKGNAQIKRDLTAQISLFNELGLEKGEPFNLISEYFGTGGERCGSIHVDNGLKNVYMTFKDGYTVIDWSFIMEQATNIHAIASSNIYLFELLELEATEIHIYLRTGLEKNHNNYNYLLKSHKYILHDNEPMLTTNSLKKMIGDDKGNEIAKTDPAIRGNVNNIFFPMDNAAGNVMKNHFPALISCDYFSNFDSIRRLSEQVNNDYPDDVCALLSSGKNLFFINVFHDFRSADLLTYINIKSNLLKKCSGKCHFITVNAKEYNVAQNVGKDLEANINVEFAGSYEIFERGIATTLIGYQHLKNYFLT